ncbi:hypothetical protein TELCIR_04991 [Teladorsagia circumcincta]|uniref:Uncharacterized protein n=1 Tax=Teladorsagia circumcincta TaxID=45464 RepID=A0A2G9UU54_TELCI|nr:hypothetical protein TELCIR_04991 [Teladorsagia circumcincta]
MISSAVIGLRGPAPALFFLGDTDTELHRDPAILQHFMFGGGPAGKLDILLTRYNLDCEMTVKQLTGDGEMEFYEAFLKFFDRIGAPQLHPIPILNNLIRSATGTQLNQLPRETNGWVLTRRFFLGDDVGLTATNSSPIIRYAKNIEVHVELQTSRDGMIFPPYISMDYAETSENSTAVIQRNFRVTYTTDPSRHDRVAIVERIIVDHFHNFIDLCSIANISVMALTHPLHGHYIHGRSPHGRADTGMAEMNEFLQKERDDLCGFRGLEPTSHLQTFIVSLPVTLRSRYDEIMTSMRNGSAQIRLSGLDQTTAKMAGTVQAHEQMNTLLREFIDHSTTDMEYTIRHFSFPQT